MKLLFVLTFKGSLEKWTKEGIANREMEIPFDYLRRDLFSHVQLFSYSPNDAFFLDKLGFDPALKKRIELIVPENPPTSFWDYLRHSIDVGKIRRAVKDGGIICKTNQINGCWTALLAGLFGAKVLVRCGYILSRRLFKNGDWAKGFVALLLESIAFNGASSISVTTHDAQEYVHRLLWRQRSKIFVAPTYVNTELFNAVIESKLNDRKVLFIGRLVSSKNVLAMVEACHLAKAELTIVGRGSLETQVLARSKDIGLSLTHFPVLMNEEIANLFKTHRYFLLPSLHEGLPKVLIEAMSASMICIGTPTSGTVDLIVQGKTGYLSTDFSAASIAHALDRAFNDPHAEACALAARAHVLAHHTIASYVEREYSKMKEMLE